MASARRGFYDGFVVRLPYMSVQVRRRIVGPESDTQRTQHQLLAGPTVVYNIHKVSCVGIIPNV